MRSPHRLERGIANTNVGGGQHDATKVYILDASTDVDALLETVTLWLICPTSVCSIEFSFRLTSFAGLSVGFFTGPSVSSGYGGPAVVFQVPVTSGRLFTFDMTPYELLMSPDMRLACRPSGSLLLSSGHASAAGNTVYYATSCDAVSTAPCTPISSITTANWRYTARPVTRQPQYAGGARWVSNAHSGVNVSRSGIAVMHGQPYQTYVDLSKPSDTGGLSMPMLFSSATIGITIGMWVKVASESRAYGLTPTIFVLGTTRNSLMSVDQSDTTAGQNGGCRSMGVDGWMGE
jgi:hypothetical protein